MILSNNELFNTTVILYWKRMSDLTIGFRFIEPTVGTSFCLFFVGTRFCLFPFRWRHTYLQSTQSTDDVVSSTTMTIVVSVTNCTLCIALASLERYNDEIVSIADNKLSTQFPVSHIPSDVRHLPYFCRNVKWSIKTTPKRCCQSHYTGFELSSNPHMGT